MYMEYLWYTLFMLWDLIVFDWWCFCGVIITSPHVVSDNWNFLDINHFFRDHDEHWQGTLTVSKDAFDNITTNRFSWSLSWRLLRWFWVFLPCPAIFVNLNITNCLIRHFAQEIWRWPVTDPGFPQGGAWTLQGGGHEHAILPNSPKNCMKLKEFGRRGGGVRPSRPP